MASTKSVLIIGGSGFIGTHLALRLRDEYKVFATYHSRQFRIPGVTFLPAQLGIRNWVKRMVYTCTPDVVIFAAGHHDVLAAEANARETEGIHTGGTATVLQSTEIFQPKVIYLSSCYVFDGHRGNYHENDIVLPSSVLGKAKVGGENLVRGRSLNYTIIRSSPLFGRGNGYRLSWMDELRIALDRKQSFEASVSEVHSFATIYGLTDLIIKAIEGGVRNKVLHYGGLTKCTQLDFAKSFAKRFGFDPQLVAPKRTASAKKGLEVPPLDFSLNQTQTLETLKIQSLLLEQGFDLLDQHLVSGL